MRDFKSSLRVLASAAMHPAEYGRRALAYAADECRKRQVVAAVLADDNPRYAREREFVRSVGVRAIPFPYPAVRESAVDVEIGQDDCQGLPYVLHRGRRLFFRAGTDSWRMSMMYRGFIDEEGITGAGRLALSPHAYESAGHRVEVGDVLLDVGCSEAIFTLEHIDLISRAYVFEVDPEWRRPLNATFEPYADRVPVVIVPKLVSGEVSNTSVRLSDVVDDVVDCTYFIKMDIEGFEYDVLSASMDFLRTHRIKISCCTYHRQEDFNRIGELLRSLGFTVSCSNGYMLPHMFELESPYFRRGVIYARNF